MKNNPFAAASVAVIAASALASTHVSAQTIPAIPDGQLSASPKMVQTGTKPTLTWSILYPSSIRGGKNNTSLVEVDPRGTLTPTRSVYAEVRIVGTQVTTGDAAQDQLSLNTEARISLNGGPFEQLFYGTQAVVNPTKALYVKKLSAGQTLDFGGRFVKNDAWSPFYSTRNSSRQVIALVNGDTPPTSFPLYQSAALASYLKPYLDSSGKVKIGPLSVLIVMELAQTNQETSSYDLQDQVLLVSFSDKHPNNGHGNNLDGVDITNPGQGSGGPNGEVDPSGTVDDEAN